MDQPLSATIEAAVAIRAVKPASLERVTSDTTVQPKAIAHPVDRHLQAKRAFRRASRYAYGRQMRFARHEISVASWSHSATKKVAVDKAAAERQTDI